jgi:hypothetical protein
MEGLRAQYCDGLPYSAVQFFTKSEQAAELAENRPFSLVACANVGRTLNLLRQGAQGRSVLSAGLAKAEQLRDSLPLSEVRVALAELLANATDADSWNESHHLALQATEAKGTLVSGIARRILAQLAYQRGDWATGESEARVGNELLRQFPGQRLGLVAVWARILHAQGKESECLQVCEQAAQEQQALGIETFSAIELYIELAEARARAQRPDLAKDATGQALQLLRGRLADILDPAWRATYLREVPENTRLLQLAAQQGLDTTDLAQMPTPTSSLT